MRINIWTSLSCMAMIMGLCSSCRTTREKLLVSGCGWKQVAILDKQTGVIEWSHPLNRGEDCNDVELTKEGNILYAYTSGARMITRAQQTMWDYKVGKGEELYTATQLPFGGYMLAICGQPSRIVELDAQGRTVDEFAFDTRIARVHSQFRQVAKTRQNTYLIPLMGTGEVLEMTREKEVVNRVRCGGNPFAVQVLENGRWLVSCGDAHNFVEIDPNDRKVVRSVGSGDLNGVSLLFVAELVRYKNGNTLISNWNGHSRNKAQPLLVEVDARNQVVWMLPLNKDIVNISTVFSFRE